MYYNHVETVGAVGVEVPWSKRLRLRYVQTKGIATATNVNQRIPSNSRKGFHASQKKSAKFRAHVMRDHRGRTEFFYP